MTLFIIGMISGATIVVLGIVILTMFDIRKKESKKYCTTCNRELTPDEIDWYENECTWCVGAEHKEFELQRRIEYMQSTIDCYDSLVNKCNSIIKSPGKISEIINQNDSLKSNLNALKTGDCWCEKGNDDSVRRSHSGRCQCIKSAMKEIV